MEAWLAQLECGNWFLHYLTFRNLRGEKKKKNNNLGAIMCRNVKKINLFCCWNMKEKCYLHSLILWGKTHLKGAFMLFFHHCRMSGAPIPGFFIMAGPTVFGSATFGQVVHLRTECHMFASQTCHSMARRGEQKSERLRPIPGILTCGDTCSVSAAFYNEPSARTGFTHCRNLPWTCALHLPKRKRFCFLSIKDITETTHDNSPF